MHFIYIIENKINKKVYVGQTTNPNLRWSQHKSNAKYKPDEQIITRAIAKYGANNFRFNVLVGAKSQDSINELEKMFIKQYNSLDPLIGYNIDVGGNQGTRPIEISKKVSQSLKKYYKTHENKRKGTTVSEETKKKMSESAIGKAGTNEGKKFNDDWRLNISKSRVGTESKSHRRFSDDVEKEICRLYVEEGMSGYALGKKFACARTLITDILTRNSIEIRKSNYNKHSNNLNKFTKEQELQICRVYNSGTVSRRQLAIQFSCSATTIREILLRNNIKVNNE